MPSLQAALPPAHREEAATEKLQLSLVVMEEVAVAATEIRTIAEGTEEVSLARATAEGLGVVAIAKPRPSQVARLQAVVRGHLRWDHFHKTEVDLLCA